MARAALIVDDSASIRQMLGYSLREAGFTVIEATDGVDGLAKLGAATPPVDLVITDINMPRMDGLAFIREVRTRAEHKYTPVLVLSTESTDDLKQRGRSAGATGWLVKPFHPRQLLAVLAKVLP